MARHLPLDLTTNQPASKAIGSLTVQQKEDQVDKKGLHFRPHRYDFRDFSKHLKSFDEGRSAVQQPQTEMNNAASETARLKDKTTERQENGPV